MPCCALVKISHVVHLLSFKYLLQNVIQNRYFRNSYRRIGYSSIAVIAKCVITPSEVLFKQYYVTDKAGFRICVR